MTLALIQLYVALVVVLAAARADVFCGFGTWIDNHKPSADRLPGEVSHSGQVTGGEQEYLDLSARKAYCRGGNASLIECVDQHEKNSGTNGQTLACDIEHGLRCFNRQNNGSCLDYKIRYFCTCIHGAGNPGHKGHSSASPIRGLSWLVLSAAAFFVFGVSMLM